MPHRARVCILVSVLVLGAVSGHAATLLFSEGYESGNMNNWDISGSNIQNCATNPHTGSRSACLNYTQDSGFADHFTSGFGGANGNPTGYLSFWQYLPTGWELSDTNGQGHWWRIQGNCWQFDVVFNGMAGTLTSADYRFYDTGGSGCTGSGLVQLFLDDKFIFDNTYHHIEVAWQRNTVGNADGFVRTWIDGTVWTHFENVSLIPASNDRNFMNYRVQFPSNTGASTTGGPAYYDDLEVWDSCPTTLTFGGGTPACAAAGDTVAPAAPTNLRVVQP